MIPLQISTNLLFLIVAHSSARLIVPIEKDRLESSPLLELDRSLLSDLDEDEPQWSEAFQLL